MPAPGCPRPQAMPPARRPEPGRPSRAREWQFQNGELDDRGYRRTELAAIAGAVLCQAHEDRMSRKTKTRVRWRGFATSAAGPREEPAGSLPTLLSSTRPMVRGRSGGVG